MIFCITEILQLRKFEEQTMTIFEKKVQRKLYGDISMLKRENEGNCLMSNFKSFFTD